MINGLVAQAPHFSLAGGFLSLINTIVQPSAPVFGGVDVLHSKQGDASADESVLSWKRDLAEKPVYSVVRSAARTLFAPYPWVAISPGLNWFSLSELYYPGVVLWICCLPAIFAALVRGLMQRHLGFWLTAFFLSALLAAYTIWLGEWSTRQRVFALPAFFALAALGWTGLITRIFRGRTAATLGSKP